MLEYTPHSDQITHFTEIQGGLESNLYKNCHNKVQKMRQHTGVYTSYTTAMLQFV